MALEISSARTPHLRSLTFIGTGALLFILAGYLLIKLDKKKAKKKPPSVKTPDVDLQVPIETAQQLPPESASVIENNNNNNDDEQELRLRAKLDELEKVLIDEERDESVVVLAKLAAYPTPQSIDPVLATKEADDLKEEIEMTAQANFNETANTPAKQQTESKQPADVHVDQAVPNNFESANQVENAKATEIEFAIQQVPATNAVVDVAATVIVEEVKKEPELVKPVAAAQIQNPPVVKTYASIIAAGIQKSAPVISTQQTAATKPSKTVSLKTEETPAKPAAQPSTTKSSSKQSASLTKSTSFSQGSKKPSTAAAAPSPAAAKTVPKSKSSATLSDARKKKQPTTSGSDTPTSSSTEPFEDIIVYEFNFPRRLCGKLIGKNGVHVDHIRSKTRTQIAVRNDPLVEDLQIVCVSGKLEDVDHALESISDRFPAKHYSSVSFKPISKPIVYRRHTADVIGQTLLESNSKVLVAPNMFVNLQQYMPNTVAANNEEDGSPSDMYYGHLSEDAKLADVALAVHVTSVVNSTHVFIQLPSNPMFEHLPKLDAAMILAYNGGEEGAAVPADAVIPVEPIEYGTICAAPTSYGWHRAMVTSYMCKEEVMQQIADYNETCGLATIKFLDYGGYLTIPTNQLRQLR
jgi:hypothetical protein